jgi:EAL domain-containing protein (putative c-di-GMP-specific phosphodiesterase class I)
MYHAKNSGGNNYQFFEREMNMRALERLSLEGELRRAVASDEFMLHYQPNVNLKTGAITAVEALIRWRHPQRGFIPAAEFISAAEGCGAIVTIGQWVLREASRQALAWQNEGLPPPLMAINISAVELRNKEFASVLRATVTETGIAPHHLELELTETSLQEITRSSSAPGRPTSPGRLAPNPVVAA